MSLFDQTNSVGSEGAGSRFASPEDPAVGSKQEPARTEGPSSLSRRDPTERYAGQALEDVVAVSPSELLPPPPEVGSGLGRKLVVIGIVVAVLILGTVVALRANQKSVPELMREAVALMDSGKDDAAAIQLKNVLAREPDNLEANILIGKAYLATGALLDAESALRRARELGAAPDQAVLSCSSE